MKNKVIIGLILIISFYFLLIISFYFFLIRKNVKAERVLFSSEIITINNGVQNISIFNTQKITEKNFWQTTIVEGAELKIGIQFDPKKYSNNTRWLLKVRATHGGEEKEIEFNTRESDAMGPVGAVNLIMPKEMDTIAVLSIYANEVKIYQADWKKTTYEEKYNKLKAWILSV